MSQDEKDPYEKNNKRRDDIIDSVMAEGVPHDPKMISALDKLMSSQDKVSMHKERLKSEDSNAKLDREIAMSIARQTQSQSLRTRPSGEPVGDGPKPLGTERQVDLDPATFSQVGAEIDIDRITTEGRRATKGQDPHSEDED